MVRAVSRLPPNRKANVRLASNVATALLFMSMTSALVVERATSLNGGSEFYGELALVAEHTTTYCCSIWR